MEELKRNFEIDYKSEALQPGELVQAIQSADEYLKSPKA